MVEQKIVQKNRFMTRLLDELVQSHWYAWAGCPMIPAAAPGDRGRAADWGHPPLVMAERPRRIPQPLAPARAERASNREHPTARAKRLSRWPGSAAFGRRLFAQPSRVPA